jgi:DNA-binding MarR family transcriptional regulator
MQNDPLVLSIQQESLGVLLCLVRSEIVRDLEAEFTSNGIDLRYTPFLILRRLALFGPMSASELAHAVELDGGAMTRQLDQLEIKGLLRRGPHELDRRALRIALTETGDALLRELMECDERVLQAAQRLLSKVESKCLHDYLERVLRALRDKH